MREKSGLEAALAVVNVDQAPPVEDEPEQLALMPLADWGEPGGVVGGPAVAAGGSGHNVAGKRKAGRPPGSKNRRTEEWIDYLLARYTSPLVVLAETYSRPVGELAKRLCCSREDAFKIQQAAALGLAPYVHQRQPMAVEIDAKGVISLVIHASPEVAAMAGNAEDDTGMVTIEGEVLESEENQ